MSGMISKIGRYFLIGVKTLLLGSLLIIIGYLLWVLMRSPGTVEPYLDEEGKQMPNSIAEKIKVEINGAQMGMFITGQDKTNPVLLFVHGGAGMPEYFLKDKYPTGLDEYFTVVWWEQRGAGLSFDSKIDKSTMTHEQFINDTIEVSKYLCERFNKEKIYIMGHSWGTSLAIKAVEKSPELYNAYLAVAQITNIPESERIAHEYMMDYYEKTGNQAMVNKLKKNDYLSKGYRSIRDSAMHQAGIGTTRDMKSVITGIFFPSLAFKEYTFMEKINLWRGKVASNGKIETPIISDEVAEVKVPIYFFCGAYDYTVNYQMVHDFYEKIKAPIKQYYLFENSAHSPIFEEPEKVRDIIKRDVLK